MTRREFIGKAGLASAGAFAGCAAPERFKGFMNSVWCFTQPHKRDFIFKAIDQVGEARRRFEAGI